MVQRLPVWISFISLAFAVLGFVWLNWMRPTDIYSKAPLPAPGQATLLQVEVSTTGPYRLSAELPAIPSEQQKVLEGRAYSLACSFTVSSIGDGDQVVISRSTLGTYGILGWRNSILYGSPRFTLASGQHVVKVHNEGCSEGYVFAGGMAQISYAGPLQFYHSELLIMALPYALSILGFAAWIFGIVSNRAERSICGAINHKA